MIRRGKERWRGVAGFRGLYSVSTWGRVWSHARTAKSKAGSTRSVPGGHLTAFDDEGYLFVTLSKNGKWYKRAVAILVAKAFIPNPLGKPTVNHKDGKKKNNRASNLEWATNKEQTAHAYKMGLMRPVRREL
jgi:hypothetical protein